MLGVYTTGDYKHFLILFGMMAQSREVGRRQLCYWYAKKWGQKKSRKFYTRCSLLNTTGCKLYASVIKHKLTKYYSNEVGGEQNGFHRGRSCCDGYFTLKLFIDKK